MDTGIGRQFGMESQDQDGALAYHDRFILKGDQGFRLRTAGDDFRGADEDGAKSRRFSQAGGGHLGDEGIDLPPIGVAAHGDVDQRQRFDPRIVDRLKAGETIGGQRADDLRAGTARRERAVADLLG